MALGDKQSGVWTVSPPAFITLRGHDISTLSYSNHIEHTLRVKDTLTTVLLRHTSYKMNFRNQIWSSYPSNHLSAYKPHSKTFHNRCKRQLLRSCGKKISCIDSMWWYSCQKDFPNPLLPIVHLECIAAFTNLFASRIHGNSCPNLLSNRGTFLFRMPDFCILQHNLHHGHDHQYSLHSCSFFFHNPHSRIY